MENDKSPFVPSKNQRDKALQDWKANRAARRERIKQEREASKRWVPVDQALAWEDMKRGTDNGL